MCEFFELLKSLFLNVDNKWRWHLDLNKVYSISGVYHILTKMDPVVQEVPKILSKTNQFH